MTTPRATGQVMTSYERRKQKAEHLTYRALVAMVEHEMECEDYIGKHAYSDEDQTLAYRALMRLLKEFKQRAKRDDE